MTFAKLLPSMHSSSLFTTTSISWGAYLLAVYDFALAVKGSVYPALTEMPEVLAIGAVSEGAYDLAPLELLWSEGAGRSSGSVSRI